MHLTNIKCIVFNEVGYHDRQLSNIKTLYSRKNICFYNLPVKNKSF